MGARHSSRRNLSLNNSDGTGDATSAAGNFGKSTHRSSSSSGKLRSRWSKVARSHSDRTSAPLSAAKNGSQEYSAAEACSSISTSCQTVAQSVSVMTQTEHDGLLGWKVMDSDHSLMFNSRCNERDVGNYSSIDTSQKSHCNMSVDSKVHCIRQGSLQHVSLVEEQSYPYDKENCSSVIYSENHVKEHSCCSDAKSNQQSGVVKYLPSETDAACSAVENFRPESKTVQESSSSTHVQRQISRTSVGADMIKLPDKRKQSYTNETKSMPENAVDLGSSFGSLNSEDMMFNTETDYTMSPTNVSSRHSSVDTGPLTHPRRTSGRLMSSKYAAVPECHQVQHSSSEVILQMGHSIGRKYSAPMYNGSVGSPKYSEYAVTDDYINDAVNGCIGVDAEKKLSPTEAISRFIVLLLLLA